MQKLQSYFKIEEEYRVDEKKRISRKGSRKAMNDPEPDLRNLEIDWGWRHAYVPELQYIHYTDQLEEAIGIVQKEHIYSYLYFNNNRVYLCRVDLQNILKLLWRAICLNVAGALKNVSKSALINT